MSSPWWHNNIATCKESWARNAHFEESKLYSIFTRTEKKTPKHWMTNQMPLRPSWTILFQSERSRWKITLSGETKNKHNLNIKTKLMKISLPLSFYQIGFMTQKNGQTSHDKFQSCLEKIKSAAWRELCSVIKSCKFIFYHYWQTNITCPPNNNNPLQVIIAVFPDLYRAGTFNPYLNNRKINSGEWY